jgi:mycothiol synthase
MEPLPQLRMRHGLGSLPAARALGPEFCLRVAVVGDASGLATVLTAAFGEVWDVERVFRELFNDSGVPVTFLVERDGAVVGTASYQVKEEPDPRAGWVHWVGVHPGARGFGLGEVLTHRVLREAVSRGASCVYLTTDDFRVPAIRVYVRLGFEADSWHESHAERWQSIGV